VISSCLSHAVKVQAVLCFHIRVQSDAESYAALCQ